MSPELIFVSPKKLRQKETRLPTEASVTTTPEANPGLAWWRDAATWRYNEKTCLFCKILRFFYVQPPKKNV